MGRRANQRHVGGRQLTSYDSQHNDHQDEYTYDEDPDVVAQPLYKSYNAWPFAPQPAASEKNRSEHMYTAVSQRKGHMHPPPGGHKKPLSNQRARAIVQQDYYYMSRLKMQMQQSSSQQSLTNCGGAIERSHTGTAASTQLIGGPMGLVTSYDAFQNRGVSQPRSTGPAISSLHHMHAVANSQQRETQVALVAAAIAAKEQYSDLST